MTVFTPIFFLDLANSFITFILFISLIWAIFLLFIFLFFFCEKKHYSYENLIKNAIKTANDLRNDSTM